MRILMLSGLKIFPNQSGGHLRSGGIAKALARMGHDVWIYSLGGRREDYGHGPKKFLQTIEENLIEEVNLSLPIGLMQTTFRRLAIPRVWQYYLLRSGLVPNTLKERLNWADAIICDFPYTPPVSGPWRNKPWILISHNLEQKLLMQGLRGERSFAAWMGRVEASAAQTYDAIFACAQEDYTYFKAHSSKPDTIRLVPNGIDPQRYRRSSAEGQALRAQWGLSEDDWLVVFSGSRFPPNVDALEILKDFCAREADFLKSKKIHFLILGSMELKASRRDSMIITGPVPETLPYFAAADAAINPVTRGSGSNVKIFEYIAAGLPVLSSDFGVRGTKLEESRDYILIEDLKDALQSLVGIRNKPAWKIFAEEVWKRHREDFDMTEILKRELENLPPFDQADD